MSIAEYQLAQPPADGRERQLWLEHAAGFILFKNVRERALGSIDQAASEEARKAAAKAVDDCMYSLMMLVDGVTGGLKNETAEVDLRLVVRLTGVGASEAVQELDLREGDGVCMGFHGWKQGDFGDEPVVVPIR